MAQGTPRAGDVWLIANPRAGNGRGSRHASATTRALHDAGIVCRMMHPSSAQGTSDAAQEAVSRGARAVVACGGDGTVNAVLQGLVGTDVPLGIVAGGSGDDIAATLGFPVSDSSAVADYIVRALDGGRTRVVDVGQVTSEGAPRRYYVGVLSTGFDSAVNERANRMPRLAGQRYNAAIVRELASFRPVTYDVTVDGEHHHDQGMLVAVGNGHRYGNGMLVCPAAEPDDGLLDLTWLGAVSTPTFLRVFPSVFRGEHVRHPAVTTYRGRSVTISASGQIAYADGERIGPLPISVEVVPGALRVLTC
jgi:diacylglycerol kinase (ATP)